MHDCLQELRKRLQQNHGNCAEALPKKAAADVVLTATATRTGTDGFLHHTRLGLVGWISYWCLGDSALTVDILVALTKMLGLMELVSDALANSKTCF